MNTMLIHKIAQHHAQIHNTKFTTSQPNIQIHNTRYTNTTSQCPNPQYMIHNALHEPITNSSIFSDSSYNTKEGNDHVPKTLTLVQSKANKDVWELP